MARAGLNKYHFISILAAGWLLAGAASAAGEASGDGRIFAEAASGRAPLRVLILSGASDHEWRTSGAVLRGILADSGRFEVRVCESPIGLAAQALAGFDVVVDNQGAPELGSATENAIAGFVESGKGLVVTHAALRASARKTSTGIRAQIGRQDRTGSPGVFWPVVAWDGQESNVRFIHVKITQQEHPIVRGMAEEFRVADGIPRGLRIHPAAGVIASARGDADGSRGAQDEPVLIASTWGKGRVLAIALGHDASAMHEREFKTALARGTEWAATGAVTLPVNLDPPRRGAELVRGLLVTGGHDHEAAFYSLFDGYSDLDYLPVMTSGDAFKGSLKNKCDVVIMYDFSRDLDESGKKNLRDFVESGGGVVVLHHALLNYQKWTWWSEEAVGGRYRLSREGTAGSSSVKNDQQIYVTPRGEHPITSGIGAFHITDEAYKNLWMSPRIRPLLTTDNPTSDVNLAWIGPGEGFRVVAIQLGHGHTAFGHPSYRTLVHRAVLWAAGKLK